MFVAEMLLFFGYSQRSVLFRTHCKLFFPLLDQIWSNVFYGSPVQSVGNRLTGISCCDMWQKKSKKVANNIIYYNIMYYIFTQILEDYII